MLHVTFYFLNMYKHRACCFLMAAYGVEGDGRGNDINHYYIINILYLYYIYYNIYNINIIYYYIPIG